MTDTNGDSMEVKTPFFSGKIAGKNLTLRDIVLLLVFGCVIGSGVFSWTHSDASDKKFEAILHEIKESRKESSANSKTSAFYSCKQACVLQYEQKDRVKGGVACEAICAPVKQ